MQIHIKTKPRLADKPTGNPKALVQGLLTKLERRSAMYLRSRKTMMMKPKDVTSKHDNHHFVPGEDEKVPPLVQESNTADSSSLSDSGSWRNSPIAVSSEHNNRREQNKEATPNTPVFSSEDFALLRPHDPVLPLAGSKKTDDNKERLRQRLLEIEARLDNVQQGFYNARRRAQHVLAGTTKYDEGDNVPQVQHCGTNDANRHAQHQCDDGSHADYNTNKLLSEEEDDGTSVSSLTLSECWLLSPHHAQGNYQKCTSQHKVEPDVVKQVLVTGIHLLDDSFATR